MDFPTQAELRRVARDELLTSNSQITSEAADLPGTDVYAFLAATAAVGDEMSAQLARLQAALLVSSAKGTDLDRLVLDRYGVKRKAAAPAVGTVTIKMPAVAPSSFSIPSNTTFTTDDGIGFISTSEVVFPAATTTSPAIPVRATLAGLATQARAGSITQLTGIVPGVQPESTVTNAAATAGAADAEKDDSLRGRALAFFLTARRGTVTAIQQGALGVPGVETANAIEVIDALGRPASSVQLIITDQFTEGLLELDAVPPAYQTQSAQFAVTVFDGLLDSRAAGIAIDVFVAKVVILPIVIGLAYRAGYDIAATTQAARAAVVSYTNGRSGGTTWVRADAVEALRGIAGLIVSDTGTSSEIISPAGDVVAAPLEVIRTATSYVSIGAAEVD